MAKNRMINTKFWSDNYISELDPSEKLLFLYLMTNPYTNICGIYEITIKQIALDTGFDKEMIFKIIERFQKDEKIAYVDGWVGIKNFTKHQKASGNVQKGIENGLNEVPVKIMADLKQILNTGYTQGEHSPKPELKLEPELKLKPEPQVAKPQDVVNYFFQLKGWDNKGKDFYKKNKIIYARFTKPAKELLELCDKDLKEAKNCLDKIYKWASSRDLDWSIETVFKKWYDLDFLKPKEKKPFIDGQRAFKKSGKWYLIDKTGEIKEYVGSLKNIEYK